MAQDNESTQVIYNEGRVVGLSAWEIYKRQALGNGVSETDIPNEHEWIASMIGAGSSMILNIPVNDLLFNTPGILEFELPSTSNLAASGVVIASPFMGECEWDTPMSNKPGWATKVKSYGSLIQNDGTQSPSADGSTVPSSTDYNDYQDCVTEFIKITDGIVFTKNAKWIPSQKTESKIFPGDGTSTTFTFTTENVLDVVAVYVGVNQVAYTYNANTKTITVNEAPPLGSNLTAEYNTPSSTPKKDIDPDYGVSSTVIRLYFSEKHTKPVQILFTGFANKYILQGLAGYAKNVDGYAVEGSTDINNNKWVNGGMLGPEITPWANKIIFMVPNSSYELMGSVDRQLPYDKHVDFNNPAYANSQLFNYTFNSLGDSAHIKPNSVIDFNSIKLTDYYTKHQGTLQGTPMITEDTADITLGSDGNCNVLTAWYPGMSVVNLNAAVDGTKFYPPALYAVQITSADNPADSTRQLVPIDTAAPGTVKGFTTETDAFNYTRLLPDNYALYHDITNNTYSFVSKQDASASASTWAGLAKITFNTDPMATIQAGAKSLRVISLTDAYGDAYNRQGTDGTITVGPSRDLIWQDLLDGLAYGNKLDILGTRLHALGNEMTVTEEHTRSTIGIAQNNQIDEMASAKFTLKATDAQGSVAVGATNAISGVTSVASMSEHTSIQLGENFIEFKDYNNGTAVPHRLYISSTMPDTTNVPVGSIGIGWVVDTVVDEIISENPPIEDSDSRPAMGG